ncbi:MAG: flavodoxin family protein [Clostridiales bacterium]|nr:flavodoxin family protein [Clostridiales bacterium]
MKVLLVNGSPHAKGCTYTALTEIAKTLEEEGIEWEIFDVGMEPISGCLGCGRCVELKKCVIEDTVNEFTKKAREADGFIFGTPVHYAAASGALTSFMDRAFYSGGKDTYYLKPAACIASARRAGTTAAFEQINKYFTISQMPVISSRYWNMVHGTKPEEVMEDKEGMQCMRILARNMAWFLKIKEAGEKAGVPLPKTEKIEKTSFIR